MENKNITESNKDSRLHFIMNGSEISFIDKTKKALHTDDYNLAVTLFHTGATLLSVEKDNSNKKIYIFKRICNLEFITDKLFSDLFNVKAFSFLESIKAFDIKVNKYLNKDNK